MSCSFSTLQSNWAGSVELELQSSAVELENNMYMYVCDSTRLHHIIINVAPMLYSLEQYDVFIIRSPSFIL